MNEPIRSRKDAHLDLCATGDVGFWTQTTLLEEVGLVHDALPDLHLADVKLETRLLGRDLKAPLLISAMTGGSPRAMAINQDLAWVAQRLGLGLGLGSQRILVNHDVEAGFFLRDVAPDVLLLGNIGLAQLGSLSPAHLSRALSRCGVDALCVHLNPAMEVVQPEGDLDLRGGARSLERLVKELGIPVVVKETGCGLSRSVARRLRDAGVEWVDVAGAGGTSWVAVEGLRAEGHGAVKDPALAGVARHLRDWGIPTAASLLQVQGLGLEVLASGGVYDGLAALRALALGARTVGVARPVLQALVQGGREQACRYLEEMVETLRRGLFLVGCRNLAELHRVPLVLGPRLQAWMPVESPVRSRLLGNLP